MFFSLAVLISSVLWFIYDHEAGMERKAYEARARSMVNMQSVKIGSNFSLIVADLLFFANYNQLMDAIDHPEAQKKHLMNDFALFSRGSPPVMNRPPAQQGKQAL